MYDSIGYCTEQTIIIIPSKFLIYEFRNKVRKPMYADFRSETLQYSLLTDKKDR